MSKWVKCTEHETGEPAYLNLDRAGWIKTRGSGSTVAFPDSNGWDLDVKEAPEVILALPEFKM